MPIALRFLGAADTVTGSCYVLETPSGAIMIDCGMFQGSARIERRNQTFDHGKLDIAAVVLSHAHLDHVGRLPMLAKRGFRGPVFATEASRDLAKIVLLDSAGIHEDHARRALRRMRAGKRYEPADLHPLYTTTDVLVTLDLFARDIAYDHAFDVLPGVRATFRDAGHILGSAFVELSIVRPGLTPLRLTFSGDIGNLDKPIVRDPVWPGPADVVMLESTYGDRDHRSFAQSVAELEELIRDVVEHRKVMLIPSFALERTQELLFVLQGFWCQGLLARVPVVVDSPMACDATEIFARHPECYDEQLTRLIAGGESPFSWGELSYVRTSDESRRLNDLDGPLIIIASSGMCNGGRILHHLRNRLHSPKTLVVFVGYQASGTLGRQLIDGERKVTIYGREIEVRAATATLNGFSAHGGRQTLLAWYEKTGPAPTVILIHGEESVIGPFGRLIATRFGTHTVNPAHGERLVLEA
ncbi:MAG: MBL fold metallo-hydrolase [Candidatus Schekmanbacteria bacterium]|nr:MBL fold metallo-hydrolase [Candidatus Schekmanbacteria bacterium]